MNQIYDLNSKQAVVSFMHKLIPGSMLSDKLLEEFSRDMNEVLVKGNNYDISCQFLDTNSKIEPIERKEKEFGK